MEMENNCDDVCGVGKERVGYLRKPIYKRICGLSKLHITILTIYRHKLWLEQNKLAKRTAPEKGGRGKRSGNGIRQQVVETKRQIREKICVSGGSFHKSGSEERDTVRYYSNRLTATTRKRRRDLVPPAQGLCSNGQWWVDALFFGYIHQAVFSCVVSDI